MNEPSIVPLSNDTEIQAFVFVMRKIVLENPTRDVDIYNNMIILTNEFKLIKEWQEKESF
ncbi:hypothetical protein ALGA_3195 [Labilibaculum antarcticum]|uniref:Uncharacterized protein n=1 Tax=Labilibaculum antarcticum TaxID=1717717 RepID=A0A1Y1CMB5_9BACT|nr:hypothetical protein ALGA_3195 [Labilibaculum antarcticum]